jgi:hypothetical protein
MRFLYKGKDGGYKSHVDGFWLIEAKNLFSIVLLKFNPGTREAFHTHAFNALTFWLAGHVTEQHVTGEIVDWFPSIVPKLTKRNCFHKVYAHKTTYALSFRGPWTDTWQEQIDSNNITLTNGRVVVNEA